MVKQGRGEPPEKLKDILFEIGTEELPATNLAELFEPRPSEKNSHMVLEGRGESPGENILEVKFKKAFEEKRIGIRSCKVLATPRRLVFHAEGVESAQRPQDERIKILAKQEAYTDGGQPTEKLLMILALKGIRRARLLLLKAQDSPQRQKASSFALGKLMSST